MSHDENATRRCPDCQRDTGMPALSDGDAVVSAITGHVHQPRRLVERQAEAYREVAPYLDRLQVLARRLGWPLGQPLIRLAVEELERETARRESGPSGPPPNTPSAVQPPRGAMGCICPPGANLQCQALLCPRKPMSASATGSPAT